MGDGDANDSFPLVLPVIRHLFRLYSAARNTEIANPVLRENVRARYLVLKECLKGYFPDAAIDAHTEEKASLLRELGASRILLQQRFGIALWWSSPRRKARQQSVSIKRDYFANLEHWLSNAALMPTTSEIDTTIDAIKPGNPDDELMEQRVTKKADIDAYFSAVEQRLRLDFEQSRAVLSDSDAKAGQNERIVGEFLRQHIGSARIAMNKQVIDANGTTSGEMDLCVCNLDQPSVEIPLIIAEGVDLVVQVKAILTDAELPRILKNCESLKRLERRFSAGDTVFARPPEIPFVVERVPYFVIAFESALSLKTVHDRLIHLLEEELPVHWPDGVFILNRGAIQHLQDDEGKSSMRVEETSNQTMLRFLQQVHSVARGFRRVRSPLIHYFPVDLSYPR